MKKLVLIIIMNNFYEYLNKLALFKKEYEDIVNKGALSKETNEKYKDTVKILEQNLIKLHPHIENKRNKYIINNHLIDFINKEVKDPLTSVHLGKYLFKFFYNNYERADKATEEEFKKVINRKQQKF